ncbi:MAG: DUF192 domain-containing protein [SAR324 cluster bacterium]|uniref:DUF192 domain-containing protein n=1 Tax=SAR324 cluster bacterium TaxID=2024889 RepID=A0A7X9IKG3_9DELT|nr:DUF192 domain-containing protein [SAR324 cluster bacterium]
MGTNKKWRRLLFKQAILLAVFLVLLIGGLVYFVRWWKLSELVQAQFIMPNGKTSPLLYLEVANDPAKRAKGLMYRKELDDDGGMLFVFPTESEHKFWMRNTYISLDMIHIGRDQKVVGILENRPVFSEESKGVGKPALYVIEVRGGLLKQWGLEPGSKLEFKSPVPEAR